MTRVQDSDQSAASRLLIDHSVVLVTAAHSVTWSRRETIFREVNRATVPDGVLAI